MFARLVALPAAALIAMPRSLPDSDAIRGFTAANARIERDWETKFRALPDPARLRESMRRLSARPHHLGSPYDKDNAEWIRAQYQSYGWDAKIEQFQVLFPVPLERVVELVAPTRFKAALEEPTIAVDPTSGQKSEQLPTYNAYSADGDVTAPLVYVNYGVPDDYTWLERHGVSVKGAIVIARYGGSWRGIKPKVAYEHGAVGCLIYSDPRDDGFAEGETFPNGPYRPKDGVQRGSVMDMPVYPGDPLTPGVGADSTAKRLDRKDATTIMKIPVMPISYADAQPLLAAITGQVAPASWRGGLPITYHIGPGAAKVHLKLQFDWSLKPLYDVIARIPGTTAADEWVIRGNHHDAWVNGAEDPISGQVAELEEARGMGELLKQGWRPKRTIIYASWDGEEPALLGSTEWSEEHQAELKAHAVFYLNSDGNGRGALSVGGSYSLERFANDVARDIDDPETHGSVWQRMRAFRVVDGDQDARTRTDLRIGALGSGSDYTPFLQHAGVPTLDIGFGGEDGGGIYHSIYDDFYWYTHFSDTSFVYGRALAQTAGTMVMRMADADVLPQEFGDLSETVNGYVTQLKALRDSIAKQIENVNQSIAEGLYAKTDDPRHPVSPPKMDSVPPFLDFTPLDNATAQLKTAASRYEKAYGTAIAAAPAASGFGDVNDLLRQTDQALLLPGGLPRRPWYAHSLYAPGFYTGYGVKTMPGAREAIEQHDWKEADQQIGLIAAALVREAELIDRAAVLIDGTSKPVP
ncbi:MAG: transferrin receptor-like dimerization domain-containing protein [Gemmatimonadales bacterium]